MGLRGIEDFGFEGGGYIVSTPPKLRGGFKISELEIGGGLGLRNLKGGVAT